MAHDPVEISWTGGAASGVLRDFSRSGLRAELEDAIKIGTEARISVRGQELRAVVRSCVRAASGHLVGVEFDTEDCGKLKRIR